MDCVWTAALHICRLVSQPTDILLQESPSMGAGWAGFTDIAFMINSLLTLGLGGGSWCHSRLSPQVHRHR